jgi:hypothetical protein
MRRAVPLRHALSSALIVIALPACDNVIWGGADIEIVPPPPALEHAPIATRRAHVREFGLPRGQVIFHIAPGEQGSQLDPDRRDLG